MEAVAGKKSKVVVVGGGIAGSLLAKTMQYDADVILIDPYVPSLFYIYIYIYI